MIYLIILLFIIIVIIAKSINIQSKFKETFEANNTSPADSLMHDLEEIEEISGGTPSNNNNSGTPSNNNSGDIPNDFFVEGTEDDNLGNNISEDKLRNMCSRFEPGTKKWRSIISKYSGRVIDVEYVRKGKNPLSGSN